MRAVRQLMDLHGRVALITGGAGHVGQVIAAALAEIGASIVLLDIDMESATRVCETLTRDFAAVAISLNVDLADVSAIRTVGSTLADRFGRLDILINNAALVGTSNLTGWAVPFEQQSVDTWRKALEINLTAPFSLVQSCRNLLAESGHGSIINIGSIYGISAPDMSLYSGTPMGNPAAYAASKAGLLQLTRWLSTVLAPNVRANAITIGGISRNQDADFQSKYVARTPLRRMATEEDLKGAAVYLASDLSSYVTGQNVIVDGGWTAW